MQPELARTLRQIAANPASFYHGAIAQQIAAYEKDNGGLITAKDLASYQVKERKPLIGHYRGLEVLTSPPPSSGGIVLLEILNILSGYDLTHLNEQATAGSIACAGALHHRGLSASIHGPCGLSRRSRLQPAHAARTDGRPGVCGCVAQDDRCGEAFAVGDAGAACRVSCLSLRSLRRLRRSRTRRRTSRLSMRRATRLR